MKITINNLARRKFEEFMDEHELNVAVHERQYYTSKGNALKGYHIERYYAVADPHCEIKDGPILSSCFGNGETPETAVEDLKQKMSQKLLVTNAGNVDRKEFRSPILE